MHAILVALGSHGDVHPLAGLGSELRRRGHRVTVIAGFTFRGLLERLGFEFVPLGDEQSYADLMKRPELWHPLKAFGCVMRHAVLPHLNDVYEAVVDRYVPGETVVVSSTLGLGARLAQDHLGVPTATVHLQPSVLRSVVDPARLPGMPLPEWTPHWYRRAMYWLADVAVIDRVVAGPLNAFRAGKGLPPVKRVFRDWLHSPQRVIGFFPEWFAPPPPDWPEQTRLTDFPLYDEAELGPLAPEIEDFLATREPPLVFTPGSANAHAREFLAAAVEACERLGRPGMLLCRFPELIPSRLPADVCHAEYVPLSLLLPRAAALVHHGGIGTLSQGFAAGVPQLVMPMAHDQLDNAARLRRLGAGDCLPPTRFRGPAVAARLASLARGGEVRARCQELSRRIEPGAGIRQAAVLVEQLAELG